MSANEPVDAAEVVIRSILRGQWDSNNTLGVTPNIHFGWVDPDATDTEITLGNPEESPINGGETGYEGWRGDGSGPVQNIAGTVEVNVWTSRERTTQNPRQLAHYCRHEIRRILTNNANAPTSDSISRLADMGARRFAETDENPVMYRYRVDAGYGYHDA